MIYALLSKIVASRIYAILWAKSLRMPGLGGGGGGGQPNLGNACILGTFGPVTHPLLKCKNWKLPHFGFPALVQLSVCLQAAPLAVFKLQHGMMIGQRSDQIAAEEEENDQG